MEPVSAKVPSVATLATTGAVLEGAEKAKSSRIGPEVYSWVMVKEETDLQFSSTMFATVPPSKTSKFRVPKLSIDATMMELT